MEKEKFKYGVEILLAKPDDFLKVKETVGRMGLRSKKENTLFQSCHILHKLGKYYILHFLEFFLLDGKSANFTDDDFRRRNTIAKLLHQWKLCKIVNMTDVELTIPISEIFILPYKDKKDWTLVSKYSVGGKK